MVLTVVLLWFHDGKLLSWLSNWQAAFLCLNIVFQCPVALHNDVLSASTTFWELQICSFVTEIDWMVSVKTIWLMMIECSWVFFKLIQTYVKTFQFSDPTWNITFSFCMVLVNNYFPPHNNSSTNNRMILTSACLL